MPRKKKTESSEEIVVKKKKTTKRKKKIIEEKLFIPSPYQQAIFDFIEHGNGNLVVEAAAGSGKCLGRDTLVLMHDGSRKKVQDIVVGDLLMGDDQTPRTVLSTTQGEGMLKKIIPQRGEPWICNDVHVLTLRKIGKRNGKQATRYVDIPINEFQDKVDLNRLGWYTNYKLIKKKIKFEDKETQYDPYFYGLTLMRGITENNSTKIIVPITDNELIEITDKLTDAYIGEHDDFTFEYYADKNQELEFVKNKIIDDDYLYNSEEKRLLLLAGILDASSYSFLGGFSIRLPNKTLLEQFKFLINSLGLYVKDGINENVVIIRGNVNIIPFKIKRNIHNNYKFTPRDTANNFRIEDIGRGDYYGFTLDGNGRFLLGDCIVTHNTSTIVKSIDLIDPKERILFCAFNRDIVKELEKKIGKRENVDVRTIHSLGYQMIQRNFPNASIKINNIKYRAYIQNNLDNLSTINLSLLDKKTFCRYIDNINKLVNWARLNLYQSYKEIETLIDRHGLNLIGDEIDLTLEIMDWGKHNTDEVDYTDMIWLPNALFLKPIGMQFDFIMADECQDISAAQRETLLKCRKLNTRLIFVGDENQSIYGFASADIESMNVIKNLPNTHKLPLSISYRCADKIVEFAQQFVPTIEKNHDGREGEIVQNAKIEDVQDGDMVLCRCNAPLMKLYGDFMRIGKKCQIRGKDIGLNLKQVIKATKKDKLNVNLKEDGVFIRLYESVFESRNTIMERTGLDADTVMNMGIITDRLDLIKALELLSYDINSSEELMEKINSIFSDKEIEGIALSTIHKAKGLEANNVFILCNSLMPHKSAVQDWQLQQERNLQYVAYTRPKNKLAFLNEDDFKSFTESQTESLKKIEQKVNAVLCKPSSYNELIIPKNKPKPILDRPSKLHKPPKSKSMTLDEPKTSEISYSFMDLLGKKARKSKTNI